MLIHLVSHELWRPSQGRHRRSVLISKLILPKAGERNVHGNASFEPSYFERALTEAAAAGAGLALLHSHPRGSNWQDMSPEDIAAEQGHAAAAFGATGMPLAGLTIAGANRKWSGRLWERTAPRQYQRVDCGSVRVVGDALDTTFYDRLMPPPRATREQVKTVSCWGERHQRDLARIRVGIIGAGSVGGFVAEALARTGLENVTLIDFDVIEEGNLDRLVYASRADIGEVKVERLADRLAVDVHEEVRTRELTLVRNFYVIDPVECSKRFSLLIVVGFESPEAGLSVCNVRGIIAGVY